MRKNIIAIVVLISALVSLGATCQGQPTDYDESFYDVGETAYDSDWDGCDDSLELEIDADTTGGSVSITVNGVLNSPGGSQVDSDSSSWTISGTAYDYGYIDLVTNTAGSPGYYSYSLNLYDGLGHLEDTYSGSVYLYPLGYCSAPTDYDESFWDVTESFPWSDEVCLDMDVDTTGGYVTVTVEGYLYTPTASLVDSVSTTWTIYGSDYEYGSLCLIAYWGGAGWYDYELYLYDDLGYYEDSWYGSVYLY